MKCLFLQLYDEPSSIAQSHFAHLNNSALSFSSNVINENNVNTSTLETRPET